jgi:hypothetical protein
MACRPTCVPPPAQANRGAPVSIAIAADAIVSGFMPLKSEDQSHPADAAD